MQVLYSFGNGSDDPTLPDTELVQGSDGNFYGTTRGNGPPHRGSVMGYGTIFKVTPSGDATVLHRFPSSEGYWPIESALVQASDGNFYGTTQDGGTHGYGSVFRLTPSGAVTTVHSFEGRDDGNNPLGGVVQGRDGNFYGTTLDFSAIGSQTIFKLTPEGIVSTLHRFRRGNTVSGSSPRGGLTQGSDGNFYGTTALGGPSDRGTIYKITPEGTHTPLHWFSGGTADGEAPNGRLVQGSDGDFYGTTYAGGANGAGTVFKVSSAGVTTILHSFGTGAGAPAKPMAGLVRGRDNNFYGTTYGGGSSGNGTIFKVTPEGEVTVLHSFASDGSDGLWPEAGLTLGSDGNLYGVARYGGRNSTGTFFKIVPR